MVKERIDVLLVQQGYFDSREKAKRAVMAGLVFSGHHRVDKPGTKVDVEEKLAVKGAPLAYVSRGGLKLEKAIKRFALDLQDKCVLDIGSSTGGFTDCALQNGAHTVYALDVGYGQLDWKLRNDHRVVVMERTNFRYVKPEDLTHGLPDFATIDVSFISLHLILPPLFPILKAGGEALALIKPQFEAGRNQVGKKGIVRDASIHREVLEKVSKIAVSLGFSLENLDFSPITGGEGNIEFLLHLKKRMTQVETKTQEKKEMEQTEKRMTQGQNVTQEKLSETVRSPGGWQDAELDSLWIKRMEEAVESAHLQFHS